MNVVLPYCFPSASEFDKIAEKHINNNEKEIILEKNKLKRGFISPYFE